MKARRDFPPHPHPAPRPPRWQDTVGEILAAMRKDSGESIRTLFHKAYRETNGRYPAQETFAKCEKGYHVQRGAYVSVARAVIYVTGAASLPPTDPQRMRYDRLTEFLPELKS